MKLFLPAFLAVVFTVTTASPLAFAQPDIEADSSYRAILALKTDSLKVKALSDYGDKFALSDSAKALQAYREALKISRSLQSIKFEVQSLLNLAYAFRANNLNDKSLSLAQQALKRAKQSGNSEVLGMGWRGIGNHYMAVADYTQALKYLHMAESCFKKTGDKTRLFSIYITLSQIFDRQMLPAKGVEFAEKAIEMARELNNPLKLGQAYMQAAGPYSRLGNEGKMMENALKAIPLLRSDPLNQAEAYLIATFFYVEHGQYPQSALYSDSSYRLIKSIHFDNAMTDACVLKARSLWGLGKFGEAYRFLEEAGEYAKKDGGLLAMKQYQNTMWRFYEAKGDYKNAFHHYHLDHVLEDSLKDLSLRETSLELEAKYQASEKEKTILKLKKEKQVQDLALNRRNGWLIASLGGLIFAVSLGFYSYKSSRQKQEIQQAEIENLKKEKQLEALSGIVKGEENERNRMAQDLHDGLGSLLSGVKLSLISMKGGAFMSETQTELFSHSITQLDGAIAEIRRVAHNLMPAVLVENGLVSALENFTESLNESGQIRVHFEPVDMSQRLGRDQEIVAYRMVQEAVNNAIKHAEATQIIIQMRRVENQVELEVEDNGKGFDPTQISKAKSGGLLNLQHRAEYLNGTLEIRSEAGTGTTVLVSFPV